jgi:hypothetical protein
MPTFKIPKPTKDAIKIYEENKTTFTSSLNEDIMEKMNNVQEKDNKARSRVQKKYKEETISPYSPEFIDLRKGLIDSQVDRIFVLAKNGGDRKKASKELGCVPESLSESYRGIQKRDVAGNNWRIWADRIKSLEIEGKEGNRGDISKNTGKKR